jgi:phospholipase D-like protein
MSTHQLSESPGLAPGRRSAKSIVLGVVSFAPLAAVIAALAAFVLLFLRLRHAATDPFAAEPSGIESGFSLYGALAIAAALASVMALVALLIDVFTNAAISGDRRLLWLLVLLFANVVGFPIYWYVVHWRTPARATAAR